LRTTRDEGRFVLLCLLTDLLLYWVALNLATLTRLHTLIYIDMWRLQMDRIACTFLLAVAALVVGSNALSRLGDAFDSVYYSWVALGLAGLVQMVLVSLLPGDLRAISRREIVLGLAIAAVLIGLWRCYAARLVGRFGTLRRFFHVFGSTAEGSRIIKAISSEPSLRAHAQHIDLDEARSETETHAMAEAIVALTGEDREKLSDVLSFCEENYRRTFLYPSLHDVRFFPHSNVRALAGVPLVEVAGAHTPTPYLPLKRLMDVVAAALGLLLASPICLLTAIAIKATSRGRVFYGQMRVGKDGHEFQLYKFRSMMADAEAGTGPVWAAKDDARVTSVGKFIRKHRVDEIPQLWSVLKGDMSLVGPRPERPHFHREFCEKWPLFDKRLAVRPGLTSLSHVLGSYSSEPEDRLRYDLIYIGNLSLVTDFRVLLATIRVVLGAKGAQ